MFARHSHESHHFAHRLREWLHRSTHTPSSPAKPVTLRKPRRRGEAILPAEALTGSERPAKQTLGFYIGGIGERIRNFRLDAVSRMGYQEAGRRVQDLFLDGHRGEAIDAVPDQLADAVCLLGPIGRIRERHDLRRDSPITTLLVTGPDSGPQLRAIRDAVLG